jgi:MtfA peptidase
MNPDLLTNSPTVSDENPKPIRLLISEEELHHDLLYIEFYKSLSPLKQETFRYRVRKFVASKIIVGKGNIRLPDQMRAFVAASAIQVTFGLEDWDLVHFHTIRIYPKEFYSRINESYLKGGTSLNGVIWFSWKDYLSGYSNQQNGINLGLHEMAHALAINMREGNQDIDFESAYAEFEEQAEALIPVVREKKIGFLRSYAGVNVHEFFAVSVEQFFEQPVEFKKLMPIVYSRLATLLNQDPAAGLTSLEETNSETNDPQPISYLVASKKKPKILKNYRFSQWHWSLSILLMGIFISPWALFISISCTIVNADILSLIYLGIVVAGAFVFYKKLVPTEALDTTQFIFFLFIGLAPTVLGTILLLNLATPVFPETEQFQINGNYSIYKAQLALELKGNMYKDEPSVRTVPLYYFDRIHEGQTLTIHFKRGIFGFRTHQYNELSE